MFCLLLVFLPSLLAHEASQENKPLKQSGQSKQSHWWFQTHTPEYTTQAISLVTQHADAVTGVYLYAGFAINSSGWFQSPSDQVIHPKVSPFLDLSLTVGVALALDTSALLAGTAHLGVDAAATMASRNNITSLMVDYEPTTEITHAHAQAYAAFLTVLGEALHSKGVQLGMCISSWSILTEFGLYAATGVDQMMSMASTYFGSNITANEAWVTKELAQGMSLDQLAVGFGSTNSITQKWDYNWTQPEFESFMSFLASQKVLTIDMWRTDIDTLNATAGTEHWIYDSLANFIAN